MARLWIMTVVGAVDAIAPWKGYCMGGDFGFCDGMSCVQECIRSSFPGFANT
jgi:hypothetical protein